MSLIKRMKLGISKAMSAPGDKIKRSSARATVTKTQSPKAVKITTQSPRVVKKESPKGSTLVKQEPQTSKSEVCVLCNNQFSTKDELRTHFRTHATKDTRIYRRLSQQGYQNKNDFKNALSCDICGRLFNTKPQYLIHYMKSHPESSHHYCPHCGKRFPIKMDKDRHITSQHEGEGQIQLLPCPQCGVDFYNEKALKYHVQSHVAVTRVEMGYTPGLQPSSLIKKSSNGEEQNVYYCPFCAKQYVLLFNLESHMMKVHSRQSKPDSAFFCKKCQAMFYDKAVLVSHYDVQHNMKGIKNIASAPIVANQTKPSSIDTNSPSVKKAQSIVTCANGAKKAKTETAVSAVPAGMVYKSSFPSLATPNLPIHKVESLYKCENCGEDCQSQTAFIEHSIMCDVVAVD